MSELSRTDAERLLTRLVEIPSFSGDELNASTYLADAMRSLGYDRYDVDAVGNAVGEMGAIDAGQTVVLLGHIDTVFGDIPVRVEKGKDGPVLFGRGSVDAKGPLATFTAAVARLGSDWAHTNDLRLIVIGAVEEEAATSKGARFIRDRFDGPPGANARLLCHRRAERYNPYNTRLHGTYSAGNEGGPAHDAFSRSESRCRHDRGRAVELDR